MPGMCSVPGCKGYKKARSRGVVFHSLPTRDPGRCRKWLKAIQNPKFDENTPVSKYGNIRVCSQHFKPEDYEPDIQAELMKTTSRKILKSDVVPSVFSGRQQEEPSTSLPADARSRAGGPSWSSKASSLGVLVADVGTASHSSSLAVPIASGALNTSSQSSLPSELIESLCSVACVNPPSGRFHQEAKLGLTATSKSERNTGKYWSQSRTIVNDNCLMELFQKCQTCGQPLTKKEVSHCGAQKKVRWSCLGGHRGIWMSSPHLWEAFSEIHHVMALSILSSEGTFTHFKNWAKHLHLNFMGHKTFFDIQKAYLNQKMNQGKGTEQEETFAKWGHQQPEGTLLHSSDPLEKINAKIRREKVLSSWSSYEQKSSKLLISPGPSMQEPKARSSRGHVSASEIGKLLQKNDAEHQSGTTQTSSETYCIQDRFEEMEVIIDEDEYYSVENRLSDSDSDMGNAIEAAELSAAGADDSGDEDVHVPIFPQRSHLDSDVENAEETPEDIYVPVFHQRTKASELLLECEEEELQPWQKQTSHVHLKVEVDDGELSNDQTDIKPDPSLLQMNAKSSSTQTVKTETPPTVYNNQGVIVVAPHLSSNTEFIDSLGTQCSAGK